MMVTEKFLWQIPREKRHTPMNHFTVLNAGYKPPVSVETERKEVLPPGPGNFDQYTYSKESHFELFNSTGIAKQILGSDQNPESSDIRNYQTMLTYSYIKNNLKPGSAILEIGNHTPHILKQLKSEFTCSELLPNSKPELLFPEGDKQGIEMMHYDPHDPNFKLPAEKYDLAFSVSIVKGEQLAGSNPDNFLNTVIKSLKKGGALLLCFTTIWKDPEVRFDSLYNILFERGLAKNEFVNGIKLATDRDIFCLSRKYYEDNWMKHVGKSYISFGKPFSANVLVIK